MKYNKLINVSAYIITIICAIILFIVWIILFPFRIILDVVFLFVEIICGGDGYVHNYIAASAIRNINHIKDIYNKCIDNLNFIGLL